MGDTQYRDAEAGTPQPTQGTMAAPRWWSRVLDGAHPWGSFDAMVSRYGIRRYRLIIYPPGSSPADRRLARLWREWPVTGAALVLLAVMFIGNAAAPPNTVLAIAVAAYVSIGGLLFLLAGPFRVQVRSMSIIFMPGSADVHERGKYIEWQSLVRMLRRADQMLTAGAISLVEHEATWWKAYDRLEAIAHV